jgi:hypothetical protein
MRLRTEFWVKGYLRRCAVEGASAVVVRHGDDDAGAIFIKVNRLDGTGTLYGPAAQAVFDEARPAERMFSAIVGRAPPAAEAELEARLVKEIRFDPDLWIIEVEDRTGRNFLDEAVHDPT